MDKRGNNLNDVNDLWQHHGFLLNFAKKLTLNASKAEDLVQDVFERALKSKDQFVPEYAGSLRAWLSQILRNRYYDTGRKESLMRKRLQTQYAFIIKTHQEPSGEIKILLSQLGKMLDRMPAQLLAVYKPIALDGEIYEKVAETLGIPVGTVRSRYSRARDWLTFEASGKVRQVAKKDKDKAVKVHLKPKGRRLVYQGVEFTSLAAFAKTQGTGEYRAARLLAPENFPDGHVHTYVKMQHGLYTKSA